MPTSSGPVVFLLGAGTPRDEFRRLAGLYGWTVAQENDGDGRSSAYEQIWVTDDRSTAIHYLEDPAPEERFAVVYGKRTGEVSFNLGRSFDIKTPGDVLEQARSAASDADKVTAAWRLAVVNKQFNPEALEVLRAFYEGGSAEVRLGVVKAIGYRGWPEARPWLEEVARSAPEEELRKQARVIIDAWWSEPSPQGS